MRSYRNPAFPRPHSFTGQQGRGNPVPACDGMSYREWLIGMSLAGMNAMQFDNHTILARRAIELADAVITQLEAEKEPKP